MSGMQLNTDFSTVKPNMPGGGMFPASDPKGWLVRIIDSGQRENSKKTGMLCVLKYEGQDQAIAGQTAEVTYNVANPNQQAVEIGFAELSAIAHVTGRLRVGNTTELHGALLRMVVGPQKDDPNRMEAKGYLDVNGNPPGKAGQGPVTATPAGFGGQQPQGGGFAPGGGQAPQQQQQQQQPPAGAWTPPAGQTPGNAPGWSANPPQGGNAPANNGWTPNGNGAPANGGQPDWSRPSA